MESKCEIVNAYTRKLTVNATAPEVDAAYGKALRSVAKTAKLPGFRPGKAPRALLERHFRPALQDAAQTQLIETTLQAAMQEHELNPIARPNVQIGDIAPQAPFEYTAFVEVRPPIELQQLDDLAIEVPPAADLDAQLAERLQALRQQHAQIEPVADRHTVGPQDVVVIDYTGRIDGKPFPGGSDSEVQFDMQNAGFIAGFAEGLLGAEVPGETSLDLQFPDDYGSRELAGKPVTFTVRLIELKTRRLPELDDEFAKDLGHDSLATLTDQTRQQVDQAQQKVDKKQRDDAVLRALAAANPFEVPPSMVESQVERMVRQRIEQFERATQQKVQLTTEQQDNLRRETLQDAEFAVRSGLLLLETSRKLGLTVSDAEVEAEIERRAAQWPDQIDQARRALSTPEYREDLQYSLVEDKTLAHLLAHARVTERPAEQAAT